VKDSVKYKGVALTRSFTLSQQQDKFFSEYRNNMSLQHSKALCIISALLAAFPTGLQAYQPCPLLRAYFPTPDLTKAKDSLDEIAASTKALFDDLMEAGYSEDFGTVTPNTTSFTVVMFAGAGSEATDDSIFFEYSYTAPDANAQSPVDIDTPMPLGTLTQLFTVYAWLVAVGDGKWETPITEFLPELVSVRRTRDAELLVDWDEVTIGALAGYMSGLARDCE
jgi:CubicO group peptidase (beta-lactamase class C family)